MKDSDKSIVQALFKRGHHPKDIAALMTIATITAKPLGGVVAEYTDNCEQVRKVSYAI